MGYRVVGIALQPPSDESLRPFVDDFHKINLGHFGGLISLLKKLSITNAVMAGKIPKDLLYKNKTRVIPDMKAVKLLFSLKNRADDTIMNAVVNELEKNGITLSSTTDFTRNLLAPAEVMTRKKPSKDELEAIKRGGRLAEKNAVVIKVSKPRQDLRFDVPVVGIDTLHSMKNVAAKVLALEAGKCIIVDKEKFIKEADNEGFVVVGVKSHD
jgi:DUF1009 family protein